MPRMILRRILVICDNGHKPFAHRQYGTCTRCGEPTEVRDDCENLIGFDAAILGEEAIAELRAAWATA